MDNVNSHRVAVGLPLLADAGTDAAQLADRIASTWRAIDSALNPIVGARGVAALYQRSLRICSADHPCLRGLPTVDPAAMDLTALTTALAQQPVADVAVAGTAHLHSFHMLLTSLVGPSLTERLLRSVWTSPSSQPPAQDAPT